MPATEEPALFALVGNTPLVELRRINPEAARGVRILAKLEMRNPGGSVKDRAALAMIRDGLARGLFPIERTLVDATSGNTGIAYAMLCAALGRRCRLYLPSNASAERLRILRAYGAQLVLTDALEGQDGAIDRVREDVKAEPERWFYPDQYANPANPAAHTETTAAEIWRDTLGTVTHFVAGLGTSGTAMGTTRGLRARRAKVRCLAVEPAGAFHGIEGLKHMASSHVPAIYRPDELDGVMPVETERAVALTRALARDEGLLVGGSSGAALAGALEVARDAPAGSVVVVVFPDGGERYLSTGLFA